jgi:hypothetical protein
VPIVRVVIVASLLAVCAGAQAQRDPLAGAERFPEFRNLSGLAGSGYGVDVQGRPSLGGPVALSTPVAYVLGRDHLYFTGERTSLVNSPELRDTLTNGTLCVTYGHTFGTVNVAMSDMIINALGKQVFDIQAQLIPTGSTRLVASIGVQDFIWGGGGSAGFRLPGDNRSSRSAFGVLTYQLSRPQDSHGFYISAGVGTRRFDQGFASLSYQFLQPLRVYLEHDGFGLNTGVLASWRFGQGHASTEVGLRAGIIQQRWITLGGTLGF